MRGLSLGDVTLPPTPHLPTPVAAPFLLLDSLTGAPHLSSFTVQSGETGRLASLPLAPHATAAHPPHTRTQSARQTQLPKGANKGPPWAGLDTS